MQVSRQNLQELLQQLLEVDAATGFHFTAYQAAQTATKGLLACLDQLPAVQTATSKRPGKRFNDPGLRRTAQQCVGDYLRKVSAFSTDQLQHYMREHLDTATYAYAKKSVHTWLTVLVKYEHIKRTSAGHKGHTSTYQVLNASRVYTAVHE